MTICFHQLPDRGLPGLRVTKIQATAGSRQMGGRRDDLQAPLGLLLTWWRGGNGKTYALRMERIFRKHHEQYISNLSRPR